MLLSTTAQFEQLAAAHNRPRLSSFVPLASPSRFVAANTRHQAISDADLLDVLGMHPAAMAIGGAHSPSYHAARAVRRGGLGLLRLHESRQIDPHHQHADEPDLPQLRR